MPITPRKAALKELGEQIVADAIDRPYKPPGRKLTSEPTVSASKLQITSSYCSTGSQASSSASPSTSPSADIITHTCSEASGGPLHDELGPLALCGENLVNYEALGHV